MEQKTKYQAETRSRLLLSFAKAFYPSVAISIADYQEIYCAIVVPRLCHGLRRKIQIRYCAQEKPKCLILFPCETTWGYEFVGVDLPR